MLNLFFGEYLLLLLRRQSLHVTPEMSDCIQKQQMLIVPGSSLRIISINTKQSGLHVDFQSLGVCLVSLESAGVTVRPQTGAAGGTLPPSPSHPRGDRFLAG